MGILVRTSAFVCGWAAFYGLAALTAQAGRGVNIGAGLLAFALIVVAAFGWGFRDGLHMEFGSLAVMWGIVGVLMGLLVPVFTGLAEGVFAAGVVWLDMVGLLPFIAGLIAVPSLVGGALGGLLSSHGAPPSHGLPG